ncbi:MAG: methylenetetrahydrofolate reductase [Anaerolineae bacterium]|nr:methylenetetrahydrofolate reductase [Anaerolineae bacterium]
MATPTLPELAASTFVHCLEVLPPRGPDPSHIIMCLRALPAGCVHFVNVADSPMARPRMSATSLATALRLQEGWDTIVHMTVRDRNRVAVEAEILGAQAAGIRHHLAVSGDPIAFSDRKPAKAVRDLSVFDLIRLCADLGQVVGAVFDPSPAARDTELRRLERKVRAGACFVITQPIYDEAIAHTVRTQTSPFGIPVVMGVLPLYSAKHAEYLHRNVPGIQIPESLRQRMAQSDNAVLQGIAIARALRKAAKEAGFQGICLMPPFGHYELAGPILMDA